MSALTSSSAFAFSFVSSCDDVWSVFRAGPQPRSCQASVPHRTSTAILWGQCSAPDLNRDPVSSVSRAGPQPRACEASVPRRTSTATLWGQCSAPDLNRYVRRYVRKNVKRYVRKNVRRYVRKKCQKICQKECQKICQKECQKICQKECQKICQKESEAHVNKMSERMSEYEDHSKKVKVTGSTVLRERCQVLYWVADRTQQDHAKIQKSGWRVCLFWNASPWIKSRWQPSPDNHHPTCHGGDHSK